MTRAEHLALLGQLAKLRADRAAARLARVQGLIETLDSRADALRAAPSEPRLSISEAQVRDRWDRWRAQNLEVLNVQVARLNAAAQPQRETLAKETARQQVLTKLALNQ